MDLKVPENQPHRPAPTPHVGSRTMPRTDDDLPPSARQNRAAERSSSPGSDGSSQRKGWILGLVAAVAVAAVITLNPLGSPSDQESRSSNWKHVAAASQGNQAIRWVAADGAMMLTDHILLSLEDQDTRTSEAIRQALADGDEATADALFAQAQSPQIQASNVAASPATAGSGSDVSSDPATSLALPSITPTLTPGVRAEILRGDASFYHIHLSDSCYDDGDVVEILINGQPFFMVPITNAGATLSVPITSGSGTIISVRGVYDGGGGITVACQTSQGEGFVRVMAVGEIQPLGVVVR